MFQCQDSSVQQLDIIQLMELSLSTAELPAPGAQEEGFYWEGMTAGWAGVVPSGDRKRTRVWQEAVGRARNGFAWGD
uniref:Uncharacterized protein n=1 Tax=Globodera rostochiensis TaxID=31243 RepID=A0A914HF03_GLORO